MVGKVHDQATNKRRIVPGFIVGRIGLSTRTQRIFVSRGSFGMRIGKARDIKKRRTVPGFIVGRISLSTRTQRIFVSRGNFGMRIGKARDIKNLFDQTLDFDAQKCIDVVFDS